MIFLSLTWKRRSALQRQAKQDSAATYFWGRRSHTPSAPPNPPHTVEKNQNVSSCSSCFLEGQTEVTAAAAGYFIRRSEQLPSHRSKSWTAIQTDGGDKRSRSTRLSDNQYIKRYGGEKRRGRRWFVNTSPTIPPAASKHGSPTTTTGKSYHHAMFSAKYIYHKNCVCVCVSHI